MVGNVQRNGPFIRIISFGGARSNIFRLHIEGIGRSTPAKLDFDERSCRGFQALIQQVASARPLPARRSVRFECVARARHGYGRHCC